MREEYDVRLERGWGRPCEREGEENGGCGVEKWDVPTLPQSRILRLLHETPGQGESSAGSCEHEVVVKELFSHFCCLSSDPRDEQENPNTALWCQNLPRIVITPPSEPHQGEDMTSGTDQKPLPGRLPLPNRTFLARNPDALPVLRRRTRPRPSSISPVAVPPQQQQQQWINEEEDSQLMWQRSMDDADARRALTIARAYTASLEQQVAELSERNRQLEEYWAIWREAPREASRECSGQGGCEPGSADPVQPERELKRHKHPEHEERHDNLPDHFPLVRQQPPPIRNWPSAAYRPLPTHTPSRVNHVFAPEVLQHFLPQSHFQEQNSLQPPCGWPVQLNPHTASCEQSHISPLPEPPELWCCS